MKQGICPVCKQKVQLVYQNGNLKAPLVTGPHNFLSKGPNGVPSYEDCFLGRGQRPSEEETAQ